MSTYDAIIVGAGPAGSTAARLLAEAGANVLLLDRETFPRDKPCGGAVSVHAANDAGFDLTPVIERTVTDAVVSFRLGRTFQCSSDEALSYMTQRHLLDAYLAEQAALAGVVFRDGLAVSEITSDAEGVVVRTNGNVHRASALIGADGANGVVGRALSLAPRSAAVALEANVPADGALQARWAQTIALDMGGVPGGYGWLFPKGDHLNVGVGGWRWVGPTLRTRLSALCAYLNLDESTFRSLRGHHLPMRTAGTPIVKERALLVGDAAGLVDPLSGEGIRAAFVSGRLAAETVLEQLSSEEPDMSAYEAAVDRELMLDIKVSRQLQAIFQRIPRPCIAVMRRSDRFWRTLCRLVRGEQTYTGFRGQLGPLGIVFDAVAATSRVGAPNEGDP